jgi:hypothetical protein
LVASLLSFGFPAQASDPTPADHAMALTEQFQKIIGARKLAVTVIPITAVHGVEAAGWHDTEPYAVASAFKGPVAIYFLEMTDPAIWNAVPVPYWSEKKPERIPERYRTVWEQNQKLYFDLHQMAQLSENDATGRVLTWVWKNTPAKDLGDNPLRAFNNWSRQKVGISEKSGMRAWLVGESICPRCADNRYPSQMLVYARKIFYLNNTYTAQDLAKYWSYLATEGHRLGYFSTAEALMRDQHYGLVGKMARRYDIFTISKDGYIAPDSENGNGYRISTDAGLLRLPDGEEYAVAFMAFDSGDLIEPAAKIMSEVLIAAQRAEF